jgi:hypothetical protein
VKNSFQLESALKKKSNAITYYCICEAQAAGIMCIAWETSNTNLADLLLTKNLMDPFIS